MIGERERLAGYLRRRGYRGDDELRYVERELPSPTAPTGVLAELGGQLIGPGLWEALRGMEEAKQIIERRVILPLAEPELAGRHGVVPPRAIVLFGPPGTGKTTFAKGIASRLGWPFVELLPAELAGEGAERQPSCWPTRLSACSSSPRRSSSSTRSRIWPPPATRSDGSPPASRTSS